jgi:hypothetical protein
MVPRRGGGAHIEPMNKSPELLTQPTIVVALRWASKRFLQGTNWIVRQPQTT